MIETFWAIQDKHGALLKVGTFESWQMAEEYLLKFLGHDYESKRGEFEIVEI